jgi:hypothetical protein
LYEQIIGLAYYNWWPKTNTPSGSGKSGQDVHSVRSLEFFCAKIVQEVIMLTSQTADRYLVLVYQYLALAQLSRISEQSASVYSARNDDQRPNDTWSTS